MRLLIDHPDLYLVLFDAPVPQDPEDHRLRRRRRPLRRQVSGERVS
jgi:hypothetical protein